MTTTMPRNRPKKKDSIPAELAKQLERQQFLTKELGKCALTIQKLFSELSPDIQIGRSKHTKVNDLLRDREIMSLIEHHIEENDLHLKGAKTDIKTIAETLDLTQRRVKAAFSNHPRYDNLKKLICHHRIKMACKLITEHPNYSVNAIADECGFASKTSFYRWFIAEMGCTPMEFLAKQEK